MIAEIAFFEAIRTGEAETVDAMLAAAPALLDARSEEGHRPLLFAAYAGHTAVLTTLRAHGAVPDLHEAAALGDDAALTAALVPLDADLAPLHRHSADGWTPLHLAAFFGHPDAARRLLAAGADANAVAWNTMTNTPLHAAVAGRRDHAVIEHLLDAGADVNATAAGGLTPLHLAASRGDLPLIERLLAHGAQSTSTDDGHTPADYARERGHAKAAERLSQVGN